MDEAAVASAFNIGLADKGGRVGMRLGLPLARRNVEQLGGRVTLRSELGAGTTARVVLPAQAIA